MRNWRWGFVCVLLLASVIRIGAWKFSKPQHEHTERISGIYGHCLLAFKLKLRVELESYSEFFCYLGVRLISSCPNLRRCYC